MKIMQKKSPPPLAGVFKRRRLSSFLTPYLIAHAATDPRNAGTMCIATVLATDEKGALENLQRTRALFPDAILIDLGQSDLSVFETKAK